jgi:hypothetical protein
MRPLIIHKTVGNGPEAQIQDEIVKMLRHHGWHVMISHGTMFQVGWPDLYCCHTRYGHRFIEVKNPKAYSFTPAQLREFPQICANGSGVWILVAATNEEYEKLFKRCNWYQYLSIWKI